MVAWILRSLPGPVVVRLLVVAVLAAALVAVLFTWVFPAIAPWVAELEGDPALG